MCSVDTQQIHLSAPILKYHPFLCPLTLKENGRVQGPWKAGAENNGVIWEAKGPQIFGLVSGEDVH